MFNTVFSYMLNFSRISLLVLGFKFAFSFLWVLTVFKKCFTVQSRDLYSASLGLLTLWRMTQYC